MASSKAPSYPPLDEDLHCDVVVVGAGVAGISVASELVGAGRSVVLLEADRVAAGVTGHTTAKVSALHGAIYQHLAGRLGPEAARAYATSQSLALQQVVETAARLDADCQLENRPAFVFSESESDLDTLRAEAEAARRAGLAASFTTDTGLPFPVVGAVRVEDQLMFHPRRYLLALLDELVREGAQVFEHSRVTGLAEGRPNTVTCANGHRVSARDVVVTTHYPVFDRALLFARLSPRREFAVAGAVRPEDDPPGMYVSLGRDLRSVRSAPYDGRRLLIATGAPFVPGSSSGQEQLDRLTGWLQDRFPVADVRYGWAAQDNHTGDRVPFVGPLHPGASHTWVATGFGGWGMSNGVVAGLLLRERLDGRTPEWGRLYDTRRLHPRLEAGTVLKTGLRTAVGWLGPRVRSRLPGVGGGADLQPGEARVVTDESGRWATYVEDDGRVHEVSATCTHLGCEVAFCHAEREWQCPCHGSRFAPDGSVLQGPATRPLPRRPRRSETL